MKDASQELEIIAELHPQYGGDMGRLREMVREAKVAGADAVKVQLYDARALLGEAWAYLELSRPQLESIRKWCDQERIELMASVFDRERLAWCCDLGMRRLKIASRTLRDDRALCEAILAEGKETIVSLGYWSGPALPFPGCSHVRYLHCRSVYPALWEDMVNFPADFQALGFDGYSDHTLGIDFCLLAIARGADILEKHFSLDKTGGRDTERAHVCSMTPQELRTLRDVGGSLWRARKALPVV